jgi:hypothetical protein
MLTGPSISVNQLAQYMNSKAAKQREILYQRKYPDPEFNPGIFHREARDEISSYLADGAIDASGFHKRLGVLRQFEAPKVGTQRRINSNIDSIERFLEMLDQVNFEGGSVALGPHNPPKMKYHNVSISVRPEIILIGVDKKKRRLKGGMKLQLSKGAALDEDMAKTISAVLQPVFIDYLNSDDCIIHAPYCQVVDVSIGKIYPGVKSITQRMKDVAAECQNIAALWPSI